jgi:hypothetical protein
MNSLITSSTTDPRHITNHLLLKCLYQAKDSERSRICVLEVSNLPLSAIFLLEFGTIRQCGIFFNF